MANTRIGAQMYTVREHTKTPEDIAQTCKKLSDIGFGAVQVSALGEIEPSELRRILDDHGLVCAATHVKLDFLKDTQRCLDYHQALGCEYTAVGGFHGETKAEWQEFVRDYNALSRTLSEQGLKIGYHNHSHEWATFHQPARAGDERPIDILTQGLEAPAWFEVDTYWVAHGGADPAAWIEHCGGIAGGVPAVHFKDMAISRDREQKMSEIGVGNHNWPAILDACRSAGVKWYLIERDRGEVDPFESLKISLEQMQKMGLE